MITIDTVTLDDTAASLQWNNRYTSSEVSQSTARTLGGKTVVYSKKLDKGKSIVLEAREDTGWIQKSDVDALLALANVANATYSFDFHGEVTETVIFDHSAGPAIQMRPLTPRVPQLSTDYFIGTIRLLTV